MKSIFCVTLVLILRSCNVSSSAVDIANKFEKFNEVHYKTKFDDLIEDCVFLILEKLNCDELLNVARVNNRFSTLAADVYRRKFSHLSVEVGESFEYPFPLIPFSEGVKVDSDTIERMSRDYSYLFDKRANIIMQDYSKSIALKDYATIWNTFKHFGREIKTLDIVSSEREEPWRAELIGYLIGEYSSESLIDFRYSETYSKILYHITKPLINVEHVTFGSRNSHAGIQITRFHDLFPAVRRLQLFCYECNSNFFRALDFHMPHLEHVTLEQAFAPRHFPVFFNTNPQIKSIDWPYADPEFLKRANTHLPQLETLALSNFALGNGSIRFENVTTVDMTNTSPANLYFPRLETLRTHYVDDCSAEYLAFLNEHQHLIHLHLIGNRMSDEHFKQFTENLSDLMELTLDQNEKASWDRELNSIAIVEFLRSHDKMKRLNVINYPPHHKIELQEQLKGEWNTRIAGNCLSFERQGFNKVLN